VHGCNPIFSDQGYGKAVCRQDRKHDPPFSAHHGICFDASRSAAVVGFVYQKRPRTVTLTHGCPIRWDPQRGADLAAIFLHYPGIISSAEAQIQALASSLAGAS